MNNIKRLTVELSPELHAKAKFTAYSEGKTLKSKIEELLSKWLDEEK